MKFFLDENISLSALEVFSDLGYDAGHALTAGLRGASDAVIAMHAKNSKAILVTKDVEFGSLLIYPKGAHYGLLVLRVPYFYNRDQIKNVLRDFLKDVDVQLMIDAITVLEVGRYRRRRLN